jgi:hypothetical protein
LHLKTRRREPAGFDFVGNQASCLTRANLTAFATARLAPWGGSMFIHACACVLWGLQWFIMDQPIDFATIAKPSWAAFVR